MPLEDFFEKQVDELGKVLAQLLTGLAGFKDAGQFGRGLDQVQQTLHENARLHYQELASVPPDRLLDYLNDKNVKPENYEKLSELFFELADGFEDTDSGKAIDCYEKSLVIDEYLNQNEAVYSFERHYRIDEIKEILEHLR